MSNCPSILTLARFVAEDLDDEAANTAKKHLRICSKCQMETNSIKSNSESYLENETVHLNRLRESLKLEKRRSIRFGGLTSMGLATAAAAVIAIFVFFKQETKEPDIMYKGIMTFDLVSKRGEQQFKVNEDEILQENDALRFVLFTGEAGFIYVFSMDTEGDVSPFYPDSYPNNDPLPMFLDGPGRHELPGSVILDDNLGYEYFVVAFSDSKFLRTELEGRIREQLKDGFSGRYMNLGPQIKVGVIRILKTDGGE